MPPDLHGRRSRQEQRRRHRDHDPCPAQTGLRGASQIDELYVADISVPASVYGRLGIAVGTLFADDSIIRVDLA
jgi:hypothetical protein